MAAEGLVLVWGVFFVTFMCIFLYCCIRNYKVKEMCHILETVSHEATLGS